ncbi:MAG: hypothetical protein AAGA91_20405, partial [Pseudomonadota bacterium]
MKALQSPAQLLNTEPGHTHSRTHESDIMRSSGQAAYLEPSELAWLPTHNVIAEKENEAVSPTPQEVHSLSNFDPAERLG